MYEKGDYVICRSGGVWRVIACDGGMLSLQEHEHGATREMPAGSEEIVRKITTKEKIQEVIGRVAFIPTIQAPNDTMRNELYAASMAMYDEIEWVRVIKTVYLRQENKRIAEAEKRYGQLAEGYLHGEISVLLGMPLAQVESHIAAAVADDSW